MKLTRDQRIEIYNLRKKGQSFSRLSEQFKINIHSIKYLVRLIDKHGIEILRKDSNRFYSKDLKRKIIDCIMVDKKSITNTAINYGLPTKALLINWIRSYKKSGYDIVERKKGRPSTMKKKIEKELQEMTPEEKNKYYEKKLLHLEIENEYLKKLHTVVQARKNRQPKKK